MNAGVPLGLTALVLLSACTSGAPDRQAVATPSATQVITAAPSPAAPPTCPASGGDTSWPPGVPADLPVPPTAKIGKAEKSADGLTLVRFTTSQSVRDGVVFLAKALQPAGYTLGRGDAEAIEADVPFSKGELRGLLKMIAEEECRTQWILALQSEPAAAQTAPLLPPVTTASPSSLPFG